MNEPHEPSYYEIALTGRQVLAAFVVLLVSMVAAFFSGVWVGRGDAQPQADRVQAVDAEQSEPRPDELSFFEEVPMVRARPLGEVAREPQPGTTLRQDVGDRGGSPEAGEGGRPDDTGSGPRAADPVEPPPVPERQRDPAPSGSLATGDLVIQVLVSSEEAKAREILDRLKRNGFRAFLSPVNDAGRTLYRVRVGPFEQRAQAEEVAERLRESLHLETWITQ